MLVMMDWMLNQNNTMLKIKTHLKLYSKQWFIISDADIGAKIIHS